MSIQTAPAEPAPAVAPYSSEQEIRDAYLRASHSFEGAADIRATLYSDYTQFLDADDLVLDFGCGDGTWLNVLRDHGLRGVGIDYDPRKIAECRARGLDAICSAELADAAHLRPTAITGFHIMEHMEPMDVMRMMMILDVRKVILITPNIDHPIVPMSFWRDFTHLRPYPRMLMEQMCFQAGFTGSMSGTQNSDLDSFVYAWKPGTPGWPDPVPGA